MEQKEQYIYINGRFVKVTGDVEFKELNSLPQTGKEGVIYLLPSEEGPGEDEPPVVTLTFTEDDWDEDVNAYVKRVELNNTFIKINVDDTEEDSSFVIYNPYFKGFIETPNSEIITGFSGLVYPQNERVIYFDKSLINQRNGGVIAVFNGIVCTTVQDY